MEKERIEQQMGDAEGRAGEAAEEARRMAEDWKSRAADSIRENPLPFLVGAFVAGFLIAKVARHA